MLSAPYHAWDCPSRFPDREGQPNGSTSPEPPPGSTEVSWNQFGGSSPCPKKPPRPGLSDRVEWGLFFAAMICGSATDRVNPGHGSLTGGFIMAKWGDFDYV